MTEIKWEVGKTYKTRDGRDVIIYAIYPEQTYGVHGATFNRIWNTAKWQLNGDFMAHDEHPLDLMPPEPETHVAYLNIYNKQAGGFHSTRKKADKNAEEGRTARLRIEWKDGQFDD